MDKDQLFSAQMILTGLAMMILGCWFGWPRRVPSRFPTGPFGLARAQTVIGIVVAVLGFVLAVIGLVLLPLY